MSYIPLIGFALTVFMLLAILFVMSYLYWADRYKTPEVIAAEVMLFSEQASKLASLVGVAALIFVTIFALVSLSLQLS